MFFMGLRVVAVAPLLFKHFGFDGLDGPRLDVVLCQDSIRMPCTQDRNSVTGLLELGTPNLPTSKPVVQSLPRVSD